MEIGLSHRDSCLETINEVFFVETLLGELEIVKYTAWFEIYIDGINYFNVNFQRHGTFLEVRDTEGKYYSLEIVEQDFLKKNLIFLREVKFDHEILVGEWQKLLDVEFDVKSL